MAAEIPLSKGKFAIVDDEDAPFLRLFTWCLRGDYASTYVGDRANREAVSIHGFLMEPPPGFEVDHINENKLDNRRENLRIVTRIQNRQNERSSRSSTGVRGVTWRKRDRCFNAQFALAGRIIYVGSFRSLDDAKAALSAARREHLTHAPECPAVPSPGVPREALRQRVFLALWWIARSAEVRETDARGRAARELEARQPQFTGAQLRLQRRQAGLTLFDIAARVGRDASGISRIETGHTFLTRQFEERYLAALQVNEVGSAR